MSHIISLLFSEDFGIHIKINCIALKKSRLKEI